MLIVVTGGTGFLGHHVVARLREEGHQVRVVARSRGQDIRQIHSLRPAFEQAQAVFHLAALVSASGGDFAGINVEGLKNVLRLSAEYNVERVVYVSSFTVLGSCRPDQQKSEADLSPDNRTHFFHQYDRSKFLAWQEALRWRQQVPLNIAFPTIIFGPGPITEGNIVVRLLSRWSRFRLAILPDNDPLWNFVFVEDVAESLVRMLDVAAGQDYLLGGVEARPSDLAQAFSECSGKSLKKMFFGRSAFRWGARVESLLLRTPLLTPSTVEFFFHNWRFDSTRAREQLHHSPRSLAEGICQTWRWIKNRRGEI